MIILLKNDLGEWKTTKNSTEKQFEMPVNSHPLKS
jgi:hypothetical protein